MTKSQIPRVEDPRDEIPNPKQIQNSNDQITNEIKSLVAKVIKIPEERIDPNANLFTDLGIDSLLGVEIFAALDKKYGVEVPEDKLRNINTLNDIVGLVRELLAKK